MEDSDLEKKDQEENTNQEVEESICSPNMGYISQKKTDREIWRLFRGVII